MTVGLGKSKLKVKASGIDGDKVFLVIRPSGVVLDDKAVEGRGLPAKIERATYLGSHWEYTIEAVGQSIFVTQPIGKRFAPGAKVQMRLDLAQLAVVARS